MDGDGGVSGGGGENNNNRFAIELTDCRGLLLPAKVSCIVLLSYEYNIGPNS